MVRVIIFILYSLTLQGRKTDTERNFFLDFCFQKQNLIVTIFKEIVISKRDHGEIKGFPKIKGRYPRIHLTEIQRQRQENRFGKHQIRLFKLRRDRDKGL